MLTVTSEKNSAILEGQRDRTRALVALSSEIAHELKNPLASVKGLGALTRGSSAKDGPAP